MSISTLFLLLLVFFLLSSTGTIFVINSVYSQDNNDLGGKNKTPIEHIIIISQGRRSFDNYFGTFEGANGFPNNLTIPVNPYSFTPSFENFTISLKFRTNISNSIEEGFLINKGGIGKETNGNNLNFGIWLNEKQNIVGGFETREGDDYFVFSKKKYVDDKWHDILLTHDGSLLKLFIDKKLESELSTSRAKPDDNKLPFIRLGANFLKDNNFFIGSINNVYLWNRSLNTNEISSFLNTNHIPDRPIINIGVIDSVLYFDKNKNKNTSLYFNGSNYFDLKFTPNVSSGLIKPFHLENTKTPNLKYGPEVYEKSYNYGFMDGFIFAQNGKESKSNDILTSTLNNTIVMGYYNNSELGPYWYLASKFVLADNFFSPSPQTDLTNNLHLFTPEEGLFKKYVPSNGLSINSTILDLLEKNQIPWKVYVKNYDPSLNYTNITELSKRYLVSNPILGIPRFVDDKTLNSKIQDLNNYFQDLKHNLPNVSYIILPDSQESSPKDILKGQESVISLIISLMKSKYWKNSLFILTYSGSGGWYDHVPPPQNFENKLGFRVPTLFISPFSYEGLVDSTFYNTLSILKFIEYNFGLESINARDSTSNNILNAFNFNKTQQNSNEIVENLLGKYEASVTSTTSFKKENINFIFNIYSSIFILVILSFLLGLFNYKNRFLKI
jgi:phospholipase C